MKRRTWMPAMLGGPDPEGVADNDMASVASRYGVAETIDRLEALAKSKGLTVFARIDFGGDAARAGLEMPPAQMLIFGNPKAGTPPPEALLANIAGIKALAELAAAA